jgi:predicted dehydrogenase
MRVAVIGAGHLGRIHARLLQGLGQIQLVAVADPLASAREQVAAECQVPVVADHHQLAGRIDAAVIATPTATHHDVALDLLGQGVHVLIEKPIAANTEQADRLIRVARHQGLILQVGHVERFNPAFRLVAPQLANARYIEAARTGSYTFRSSDVGAVLDLMIHDLDLILSLVPSPVARAQALGISLFGGHEDMAQARLEFENGCVANLSASRAAFRTQRHMQVFCDDIYASIDFAQPRVQIVRPDSELLTRSLDLDQLGPEARDEFRRNLFQRWLVLDEPSLPQTNALRDELDEFMGSIRTGRAPRAGGDEARAALAVAERILDQIYTHRWDGTETGPVGPLAVPAPAVLRGAAWHDSAEPPAPQRRKAG